MKRSIATITVYVYGETDEQMKQNANVITKLINTVHPSCVSSVEKLVERNFGEMSNREIKID